MPWMTGATQANAALRSLQGADTTSSGNIRSLSTLSVGRASHKYESIGGGAGSQSSGGDVVEVGGVHSGVDAGNCLTESSVDVGGGDMYTSIAVSDDAVRRAQLELADRLKYLFERDVNATGGNCAVVDGAIDGAVVENCHVTYDLLPMELILILL